VKALTADSGGGTSSLFGASGDIQNATFDPTGLPGLLPGLNNKQAVSGSDLIKAFLAAGQSDDPAVRNLVASIEYALYQSNYYTSGKPNLYEVTGDDAKAFAAALTDLKTVNESAAGATGDGQIKGYSVAQFLTSQATLAAAGGPGAPGSATAKQKVVKLPNRADIAAAYRRVAAQLEGGRPSEQETEQFVDSYIQRAQQVYGGGNYQKAAANAQQSPAAANSLTQGPPVPRSADYTGGSVVPPTLPHGVTATDPNTGMSPEQPNPGPQDLPQSLDQLTQDSPAALATLQDVLGAGGVGAGYGGVKVTTDPLPSVDTAAEDFARNKNPGAVAQNDMGNALNDFLQLISQKLV